MKISSSYPIYQLVYSSSELLLLLIISSEKMNKWWEFREKQKGGGRERERDNLAPWILYSNCSYKLPNIAPPLLPDADVIAIWPLIGQGVSQDNIPAWDSSHNTLYHTKTLPFTYTYMRTYPYTWWSSFCCLHCDVPVHVMEFKGLNVIIQFYNSTKPFIMEIIKTQMGETKLLYGTKATHASSIKWLVNE